MTRRAGAGEFLFLSQCVTVTIDFWIRYRLKPQDQCSHPGDPPSSRLHEILLVVTVADQLVERKVDFVTAEVVLPLTKTRSLTGRSKTGGGGHGWSDLQIALVDGTRVRSLRPGLPRHGEITSNSIARARAGPKGATAPGPQAVQCSHSGGWNTVTAIPQAIR